MTGRMQGRIELHILIHGAYYMSRSEFLAVYSCSRYPIGYLVGLLRISIRALRMPNISGEINILMAGKPYIQPPAA